MDFRSWNTLDTLFSFVESPQKQPSSSHPFDTSTAIMHYSCSYRSPLTIDHLCFVRRGRREEVMDAMFVFQTGGCSTYQRPQRNGPRRDGAAMMQTRAVGRNRHEKVDCRMFSILEGYVGKVRFLHTPRMVRSCTENGHHLKHVFVTPLLRAPVYSCGPRKFGEHNYWMAVILIMLHFLNVVFTLC